MRRRHPIAVLLTALALVLAACGSSGGETGSGSTTTARSGSGTKSLVTCGSALTGDITVSAAASLTESFTELGKAFEQQCDGTKVTFTFDSSGTLSQQILDGAPVDVFASADEKNMTKLTDADLVEGKPTVFAKNQLIIVTKPGNPEGIESLADLADAGVISLCGTDVPCGTFAAEALDKAGVTIPETSVTRGQNAKATLTAVSEGDAVAGIVYVTDALAAGDAVDSVDIPDDQNVIATYPIAVLSDTQNAPLASAFAAYVSSDDGQAILSDRGFSAPS
jgi:molybdate transport system substrate-binding protein